MNRAASFEPRGAFSRPAAARSRAQGEGSARTTRAFSRASASTGSARNRRREATSPAIAFLPRATSATSMIMSSTRVPCVCNDSWSQISGSLRVAGVTDRAAWKTRTSGMPRTSLGRGRISTQAESNSPRTPSIGPDPRGTDSLASSTRPSGVAAITQSVSSRSPTIRPIDRLGARLASRPFMCSPLGLAPGTDGPGSRRPDGSGAGDLAIARPRGGIRAPGGRPPQLLIGVMSALVGGSVAMVLLVVSKPVSVKITV